MMFRVTKAFLGIRLQRDPVKCPRLLLFCESKSMCVLTLIPHPSQNSALGNQQDPNTGNKADKILNSPVKEKASQDPQVLRPSSQREGDSMAPKGQRAGIGAKAGDREKRRGTRERGEKGQGSREGHFSERGADNKDCVWIEKRQTWRIGNLWFIKVKRETLC